MKSGYKLILWVLGFVFLCACSAKNAKQEFVKDNTDYAAFQAALMLEDVGKPAGNNYPHTMNDNGKLVVTSKYNWTSGFFTGSLWYLYELTGDTKWKQYAEEWTHSLESIQTFTGHHDIGFMIFCSYGNAMRLASKPEYKDIILRSAESLASRYDERIKSIKSWNYRKAWNDTVEWFYPVIVDNVMNLELLFAASKLSGNMKYYNIAVTHAETSMKTHIRNDFSTYHVIDYDTLTGMVKDRATCQGYSNNSTWSRGQAWMVYGYTMMYCETNDPVYLDIAEKTAGFYIKNLPEDLIPLWDFNVGEDGYEPEARSYAVEFREKLKDASAAAIACSAFFELGQHTKNNQYTELAIRMLHTLASPEYRATPGTNANFMIKHCVGSIPHQNEIDKPLVYADYYFLEALLRYKNLN